MLARGSSDNNDVAISCQPFYQQNSAESAPFQVGCYGAGTMSVDNWSYSGWDLPNFHKRKNRGELLPLTSYYHEEQIGSGYETYGRTSVGGGYPIYGYGEDVHTSNTSWVMPVATVKAVADNQDFGPLVQAAAGKIYSSGHDTLTFILELRKTVRLFTNIKERAMRLLQGKDIQTLADSWLEYRYGWRILYFDMVELSKTLSSLDDKRKRFSERVGNSYEYTETSTVYGGDNQTENTVLSIRDTYSVGVRAQVIADLEPPKFQFNPAITGWELIKFSFIIDWIIGVGKWLEALSFLSIAVQHQAAGGVQVECNRNLDDFTVTHLNGYQGYHTLVGSCMTKVTTRTPTSVPLSPLWNVRLDGFKIADLIALVSRMLK